jgi:hypothetical protein
MAVNYINFGVKKKVPSVFSGGAEAVLRIQAMPGAKRDFFTVNGDACGKSGDGRGHQHGSRHCSHVKTT